MEPASRASWWKRRGRRMVVGAIVLQSIGVLVFACALLAGESSRASFIALYLPRHPLLVSSVAATLAALALRRWGLVALQVGLCVVVLIPVMGLRVAALGPRSDAQAIAIATYNVYFGKLGRPQLLEEIAAMDVDILVLQATYDSIGDRLRERLPDRTVRQDGELVLVSRYPVLDVEVPELLAGEVKPMFVGYVLQTPAGPLRVFNTHPFSPRSALVDRDEPWRDDVARREAQVAALVAASLRPGPPFVIAGDTNLPGLSAIARRHFGHAEDAFDAAGLGLGYTFPSKRPWMRIDRVLAGPGLEVVEAHVAPRGASDHRAMFARFTMSGGPDGRLLRP